MKALLLDRDEANTVRYGGACVVFLSDRQDSHGGLTHLSPSPRRMSGMRLDACEPARPRHAQNSSLVYSVSDSDRDVLPPPRVRYLVWPSIIGRNCPRASQIPHIHDRE